MPTEPEKALAAVHLDLDGAQHIFRAHGLSWDSPHDPLFDSGLRNFLDLFDRTGIRATLFVIAEDLEDPRKRELICEARARGHEIASHSLTHRRLSTLTPDDKRREVFESAERIAATGDGPRGFRAPGFDIDRQTLELLSEAGYAWDSSVFSDAGLAARAGGDRVARAQHDCRALVELPMPAYRPLPFHPSYGLVLGMWYFRLGLSRFRRTRAPLVLLFHLTDLADPLPAEKTPGLRARLFTLSHLARERKLRGCEQALEAAREHYRIGCTDALIETRT